MKPVSLTIRGLHSFRESQTIPFEALSEIGLFGIFGPTGSGKSTILDAMTLALFGSVIRATNHTQGILNHAENRVSVSFTFDAGAGFERSRYTVERVFRRGTDAAVVHQSSRLTKTDQSGQVDVLADMKTVVTERVIDVLGLTEEDFTKAVVLPQGKFAEFLHLTGSQRSRMMERLFGLERYGGRLTETLTDRERTERQQLEVTEAGQLALGDASEGALTAIEARVREAVERERHCHARVEDATRRLTAATEVWQLQSELADVARRMTVHQELADDMAREKTRLMWAERAYQVGPVVDRARRAQAAYQAAQLERDRAHQVESAQRVQRDQRAALAQAAQTKRAEDEPVLHERLLLLHQAEGWASELHERQATLRKVVDSNTHSRSELAIAQTEMERAVDAFQAGQSEIERWSKAVEQLVVLPETRASVQQAYTRASDFEQALRQHRELEQQRLSRQQALDHATERLTTLQSDLKVRREAHSAAELALGGLRDSQPFDNAQLVVWNDWVRDATAVVREWTQAEQEHQVAQLELSAAERDLEGCLAEQRELEQQVEAARQRRQQVEAIKADQARQRREQLAAGLARELIEGKPCPVCGSTDHPTPVIDWEMNHLMDDESDTEAMLQSAIADFNLQEARLQQHRVRLARIEATFATATDRLTRQSDRVQAVVNQWRALTDGHDLLKHQPTADSCQIAHDHVEQATRVLSERRQNWQLWADAVTAAEAVQRAAREAFQQAMAQVSTAEALRAQVSGDCEEAVKAADTSDKARRAALSELSHSVEQIAAACDDVASDGVTVVRAVYSAVIEQDKAWGEARERLRATRVEFDRCSAALEQARSALAEHQLKVARLEEERRHLEQATDDLATRLRNATDGEPVASAKSAVEGSIRSLSEAEQTALEQLQLADKAVAVAGNAVAAAHASLLLTEQQASAAHRELTNALASSGFATVEAAEEARLPEQEQLALVERVKTYDAAAEQLRLERDRLLGRLGERRLTEPEWTALNDAATQAQSDLRVVGEARAALTTERDDVARRHEAWLAFEAKRVQLAKRCDQLGHLRQLFRGNAFVEFVAREQMEQVARDASARLQQLTQYRYALEVASDGGFVVRDDFNGAVRRPVTTLSGGETFLTSLALALALSAHVQLRGRYPLEFFFLDEGFGTLDPDLLDTVMTSLDRLRLESLTIGVISHVPELRERMQRRLVVDPPEAGGRGSRVRLERL